MNLLTLKKYPNRRIYNPEIKSYINLNELADLIKQGRQVEIIDQKTNEDLTAIILTQIIMEQARQNESLLPVPLLHLIIKCGESVLKDFFDKYLEKAIQSYLAYKENLDEQFRFCMDLGIDFSKMTNNTIKEFSSYKTFFESL